MPGAPGKIDIKPNVKNTIRLKVNGELFAPDGRALAGRLNAVIAYWNTVLRYNNPPDETKKLRAETDNPQDKLAAKGLGDDAIITNQS